jgi:hypothetical protein
MKVGPTERICLLSDAPPLGAVPVLAGVSGAGAASGAAAGAPFLPAACVVFGCGRDIFLALSSVTMMSPCCSTAALSSTPFRASVHVSPAAVHDQDGLNSWR